MCHSKLLSQSLSFNTEVALVFSNALTNIGGGYNAVTGIFTAPLGGVYVFICKITDIQNSVGPTIYFVKNGASQSFNIGNEGHTNSFRSSSSSSIVLELSPGDRVWVKVVGVFSFHENYRWRATINRVFAVIFAIKSWTFANFYKKL